MTGAQSGGGSNASSAKEREGGEEAEKEDGHTVSRGESQRRARDDDRSAAASWSRSCFFIVVVVCALDSFATSVAPTAFPILRQPRPVGSPTTLAATRFGVRERALFGINEKSPLLWRLAAANLLRDGLRVTRLTHSLEGAGFHRTVHMQAEVTWRSMGDGSSSSLGGGCQLAMVLWLPSNLFADRFELEGEMLRRNRRGSRSNRRGDAKANETPPRRRTAAAEESSSAEVFEDAVLIGGKAAPDCNASVLAVVVPARVSR
jgi:hypothetical protein